MNSSSCHDALFEKLQLLQREADGLVFAEIKDDDEEIVSEYDATVIAKSTKSNEELRRSALDALPEAVRTARRVEARRLSIVDLKRFVESYHYDENVLIAKVREHVAWLASERPWEFQMPVVAPSVADSGVLRVCGRSMHGDAIILFDASKWHPWLYGSTYAECSTQFRKYTTFFYQVAARLALETQGFIVLVSMADRAALLRPVALRCIYTIVRLTFDHYPSRLQAAYLLGAPPLFSAAWKIIKPWLDETTIQRTFFLRTPEETYKILTEKVGRQIAAQVHDIRNNDADPSLLKTPESFEEHIHVDGLKSTTTRNKQSLCPSPTRKLIDINTEATAVLASCGGGDYSAC